MGFDENKHSSHSAKLVDVVSIIGFYFYFPNTSKVFNILPRACWSSMYLLLRNIYSSPWAFPFWHAVSKF